MFALLMGLKSITPGDLHQTMQQQSIAVIDVNAKQSWQKAHVPRALNLDPTGFSQTDLPSNTEASIVFYCSNRLCRKAPNAARRARQMGYQNVRVMSAGIAGWLAAKLPTEAGSETDSASLG